MPHTKEVLDDLAISPEEYDEIVKRLGREPNLLELGIFGSLWSEHCGYKHSKPLLRTFPSDSPRLLVPPGEENAGVVDIGDGLCIAMKIESHNHPSTVEPLQGAATGVGGIVRDIFAMGARPIALLNSLRFGPLSEPRNRHLFKGVVEGISWYGNCIGVPDVGGEIIFSPTYSGNPLVNAMCVGVLKKDEMVRARATGEGNLLMLVGADTGRDGIHGASGLASRTFEEEREMRPSVQVGNPFLEKVLIEACLEVARSEYIVGMQDLGAAGLSSSIVECADRGGGGVEVDLSQVPRRESGMTPYEIMLSESQERMLLIVKKGYEDKVWKMLEKWDLQVSIIGKVTGGRQVKLYDAGELVADLPVEPLASPPLYRLQGVTPAYLKETRAFDAESLPLPQMSPVEVLKKLLASPNIASKEPVYRQYDHQVQTNTVSGPGSDAAVLRLRGTKKGIAVVTDGNGRYSYLNPCQGGIIAVAEACRNLACVGAEPIALTDCLNFGNPERLDVYYQLEEAIKGMSEACRAFGIPVVSGNVSLYNETRGLPIYPTPIVGALGLLEDVSARANAAFKDEGDVALLLGPSPAATTAASLGGSEYLELVHGQVAGTPSIDLDLESRVQSVCRRAIKEGLLKSAHDCSDGGLAVALAESSILGGKGFQGEFNPGARWDVGLFGEAQSRIVVSAAADSVSRLEDMAKEAGVPLTRLGTVGGDRFAIEGVIDGPVADLAEAWKNGLELALEG